MSFLCRCSVLMAVTSLGLSYLAWSGLPAAEEKPTPGEKKPVRTDLYGDPLPPGAIARLGTIRLQHAGGVRSLAFSPDGKLLASGGNESIRLWDVATGRCLREISLERGSHSICCMAFSPDGKTLAAGTGNKVFFWEVPSGQPIRNKVEDIYADCIAFSPDGTLLASGRGPIVYLWDVATGKRQARWPGHATSVTHVVFSPDGKILASASEGTSTDDAVRLWEMPTGKELHKFSVDGEGVAGVVFAPDGKNLISAARRKVVRRWDVATGKLEKQVPGGDWFTALSPDGRGVIATDPTKVKMHVWAVDKGKELFKLEGHEARINRTTFSRDGKLLASASWGGAIWLWDLVCGKEVLRYSRHELPVMSLAYAADGQTLITGSSGVIRFWDPATAKLLREIKAEGEEFTASGDGKTLAWNTVVRGISLRDAASGTEVGKVGREREICYRAAISPDGTRVASAPDGLGRINLWDTDTGQLPLQIKGGIGTVSGLAYSADAKVLAAQSGGAIHLWEAASGREIRKIVVYPEAESKGAVFPIILSPDHKTVISSGRSINLWDVASGKSVVQLPQRASVLALSPDGRLLASSGSDHPGMVSVWELSSGEEIIRLAGHDHYASVIIFGASGKALVSAGADNTVLIWDLLGLPGLEPAAPANGLSPSELEKLWRDLSERSAATAYRTICTLVSAPKDAVTLLKDRLQPVPGKDMRRINQLVAELDSDRFAVRQAASQELEKLGHVAEPELSRALAANPSAEARRRLAELLNALNRHPPPLERLRQIRSIQALEQIGSRDACQVLESLARGEPAAPQTLDAQAAVERLDRPQRGR